MDAIAEGLQWCVYSVQCVQMIKSSMVQTPYIYTGSPSGPKRLTCHHTIISDSRHFDLILSWVADACGADPEARIKGVSPKTSLWFVTAYSSLPGHTRPSGSLLYDDTNIQPQGQFMVRVVIKLTFNRRRSVGSGRGTKRPRAGQ